MDEASHFIKRFELAVNAKRALDLLNENRERSEPQDGDVWIDNRTMTMYGCVGEQVYCVTQADLCHLAPHEYALIKLLTPANVIRIIGRNVWQPPHA